MKRFLLIGIGTLFTLAISACSLGAPAAPTAPPMEQTPSSLTTVKPTEPVLDAAERPVLSVVEGSDTSNLTPDAPSIDTPYIAPETASRIKSLTSLHNDILDEISHLAWQPDGKALLVYVNDSLTLLETETWAEIWRIPSITASARFTPDGRELLIMYGDNIQRRDAATGELLSNNPITPDGIYAISADGRMIASTLGGSITLTDVPSGEAIQTLDADLNSGPISDLAFSADGSKIVAGSMNGDLQAWDVQSGLRTLFRPASVPSPIYDCEVNGTLAGQPDGALLIICGYPSNNYSLSNYQIGIYPATTNAQGSSTVIRDPNMRKYRGFTVNADRSRLAVFSDKDIEIWSAFGGSRLLTLSGAAGNGMTFNPANNRLLAVWSKRSIQIWDITSGKIVNEWRRGGSDSPPVALAFSPIADSRRLAVGREDGLLELWDVSRGEKIAAWQYEPQIHEYFTPKLGFTSLAFSPDGRWLAVATELDKDAHNIFIFNPADSTLTPQFVIRSLAQVNALAFKADSGLLYSIGFSSNAVNAWDIGSQTIATSWSAGTGYLRKLVVRDEVLAVVSDSGLITAWENPPTARAQTVQLPYTYPNLVTIGPDKTQVILENGLMLEVWNLSTQRKVREWYYKEGRPVAAFSPDGCTLAVSAGNRLFLHNILLGDVYISYTFKETKLTGSPTFSANGALLAVASADGFVWIFGLEDSLQSSIGEIPPIRCGSVSPPPTPTPTLSPTATLIPSATPTPTITPVVTATFTPTPPPFIRTLSLTNPPMRGDDVLVLQERLRELGYSEAGVPDGIFGKMTDSAVRRFQEENSLEADGHVGLKTWEVLFNANAIGG